MSTGVLVLIPSNPSLDRPQFHIILVSLSNGRAGGTIFCKTMALAFPRDVGTLWHVKIAELLRWSLYSLSSFLGTLRRDVKSSYWSSQSTESSFAALKKKMRKS